ncbi:MAG: hypothetical protein U5K77_02805 [Candidatus Saccharibacteria bacterium]|nr:hypothetical protein [Candidatus Saccharibacteria bacterium]
MSLLSFNHNKQKSPETVSPRDRAVEGLLDEALGRGRPVDNHEKMRKYAKSYKHIQRDKADKYFDEIYFKRKDLVDYAVEELRYETEERYKTLHNRADRVQGYPYIADKLAIISVDETTIVENIDYIVEGDAYKERELLPVSCFVGDVALSTTLTLIKSELEYLKEPLTPYEMPTYHSAAETVRQAS